MITISKIPKEWILTKGRGVKIGILDSGCFTSHKNLNIKEYKKFGLTSENHGTHIAGIINSNAKNYSIHGLCTEADIYFAGCDFTQQNNVVYLYNALEWLKSKKLDVLNLSFALKTDYESVREILKEISNNCIICCAYSEKLKYPHSYEFVVDIDNEKKASVYAEGNFISTSTKNGYRELTGSSMSTAFVTSVFGIAKAFNKRLTIQEILNTVNGKELYSAKSTFFNKDVKQIIIKL
jgi:major intracellular serine protease